MLSAIQIKNFAIIDNLEIEFAQGFTVLTGETGAGKSIVIDALTLALGGRGETNMIRHNAERCEISITFNLKNIPTAISWLKEHELTSDLDCIIRRTLTQDGRSRCFINGTSCTLQQVRELGVFLIDIHGQHEHQALLKRDKQRELLDEFAGHLPLYQTVQTHFKNWQQTQQELAQLQNISQDRLSRAELLRYQIQELEQLAVEQGETQTLEQEHKKLSHAQQIINQCTNACNSISEDETANALSLLHDALKNLTDIKNYDDKIIQAAQLLNDAIIQTEEAATELQHYLNSLELNPERLAWIEQRLSTIYQSARKYRVTADELITLLHTFKHELSQLDNMDERINQLQGKLVTLEQEYKKFAKQLSESRQQVANKLSEKVTEKMQRLGMQGGKFAVCLEPLATPSLFGLESIEFLVSANPGQPLQALNKVASGGELSRIGLAIQVISAQKENTATLIFDEVDTGIGGGVAEIVGQLLKELGNKAQVLCITHLAQVASQGHHHFQVKKTTKNNLTHTFISPLNMEERINEIARMLGGIKITQQTKLHAKEMLAIED